MLPFLGTLQPASLFRLPGTTCMAECSPNEAWLRYFVIVRDWELFLHEWDLYTMDLLHFVAPPNLKYPGISFWKT
jgi:hypothetical protein